MCGMESDSVWLHIFYKRAINDLLHIDNIIPASQLTFKYAIFADLFK